MPLSGMFLANKTLIFLVVSISFVIQNPLTSAFGGLRSIQLSYECGSAGRGPQGADT
jgi:hypothetical protein